ncbi:hypothetical protein ADK92_12945 [Streptomyces sp. XY533]|nr:hypothetical protein ADK92_12945 [Streptomyces sp. XY533]
MPSHPPTVGTPAAATETPPAPAPARGGLLAPVTLARPTRDASGGSAAYASREESGGPDDKPGKAEKNRSAPGMWKGLAAYIANRPQQQIKVQHTISEIRGSSTDRKINHQVAEKRGATSDTKSNRTATTAHASKSDKSAKTADTRDAKTADTRDAKTSDTRSSADKNSRDAKTADTRDAQTSDTRSSADKNSRDAKTADMKDAKTSDTRDAKTSDTRSSADKNSRDVKAASDRKDHDTRSSADKTATDRQDRTGRDDKTSRKTDDTAAKQPEGKPSAAPQPGKAPDPAKAGDKPAAAQPDPANTKSEGQPAPGPSAPASTAPAGPAPKEKENKGKAKPRKGPYTAQPAREDGFKAGAQQAAAEADKAAWRDGYADGQQAIRDQAARDKAQMDATRDRTRGVPPVPPKPTVQPQPTVPPRPATPPGPPVPPVPPAAGAPLTARVSGDAVQLSTGKTLTRGEVRSLRGFTRYLSGKQRESHQIADACQEAKTVSADRVKEIQELIERCQDPKIKGGKVLIASLQKLHEATSVQAREAEQMHVSAQRGIESLRTLSHNAEARHGGVYRAVVDSPETSPAERAFYAR